MNKPFDISTDPATTMGPLVSRAQQSGLGREECFEELLEFTQVKNVNVNLG